MGNPITRLINGLRYDFSSVEAIIAGAPATQITEISWEYSLEPGHLRGTPPYSLGRTRGEFSAKGAMSLYEEEWALLTTRLTLKNPALGYMVVPFNIEVVFSEVTSGNASLQTFLLEGCRITNVSRSLSQGSDPIVVSCDLDIMMVIENSKRPVAGNKGL